MSHVIYMHIHTNSNKRRCPSGSLCMCAFKFVCTSVHQSGFVTNGVIIDAESRLLLIAMVGYRPNEYTNTHINAHTHTQLHTQFPPSASCSHTNTHKHTQTHTHIFIFSGSRRCTYAHKPSTSANKLTHPDIPLATS